MRSQPIRIVLALGLTCAAFLCVRFQYAHASSQFGDANCDGSINSLDAALILQVSASLISTPACPENVDLDFDGRATSVDAELVLEYHAALLAALPPSALKNMPTTCPSISGRSEGTILANRILSRTTQDLILNSAEQSELAEHIDDTLAIIRAAYPRVADVRVRQRYVLGLVGISPEPALARRIRELAGSGPAVTFITGYRAFDLLNARLQLRGFYSYGQVSDIQGLCFPEELNVPAAAQAYRDLEDLESAWPGFNTDGPDIEATLHGDTWYVIFADRWGDCPAGCTKGENLFFTVTDRTVRSIEEDHAQTDATFADLLDLLRPG